MELQYQDFLKGQFLMAMPGLADSNFAQTVTLICEHTPAGAVGIIINRVHSSLTGKDIFDELKVESLPKTESIAIHLGGPVHVNDIFVLHGPPFNWKGCLAITPTLAMSNTIDILEAVALGRKPESFLISLGCAGWGPGQLETEVKQNAWLTGAASEEVVFDLPVESRWEAAVRKVGIDPALLSDKAGHA